MAFEGASSGLGTRSHFHALVAQNSASGSLPATNGAALATALSGASATRTILSSTARRCSMSEEQLQGELADAWIARAANAPEGRCVLRQVRVTQVDPVGCVEK